MIKIEKMKVKRFIKSFVKGWVLTIELTIGLPFMLLMAVGYWTEADDNVYYMEAFKKVLQTFMKTLWLLFMYKIGLWYRCRSCYKAYVDEKYHELFCKGKLN